ncbi:MAG: nitrogenase iron-molybdenum cofactor biosynthesis protein NifE [Candidatus Goldbacteria bacterium]|nr:nitrogenase iron-molybdenum cofactor biosynthesis protein NifE [Candidatus Goldiibacteriota bacterium]
MEKLKILEGRRGQVFEKGKDAFKLNCGVKSTSGAVSQRACVFCGSRVVLYPITDALHLVHGPIGCAAYTWDIRGSMSSGPVINRHSFSTDLREIDVIYGGAEKLYKAASQLIDKHKPEAAFIYSTCIVGLIGDDVEAVCKKLSEEKKIPVINVDSAGFKGTKKDGYKAACESIAKLVGTGDISMIAPYSINILGEFNLAGEAWIIKDYYTRMGVNVNAVITGDGRVADLKRAHGAALNVVQCAGSMTYLAEIMKKKYNIPFIRVSYFGLDDMTSALYDVAAFFEKNPEINERAGMVVKDEMDAIMPGLLRYRKALSGKKAALYVGGAFKAFSLIKALRVLGMDVVLAGSQTGNKEDYEDLKKICDDGAIIIDDANPQELSRYITEKKADVLIGGVKERPIAYKIGIGFCDHNHERKIPLAGYAGMLNFAGEVYSSVMSPVWKLVLRNDTFGQKRSRP